MRIRLLFGGDMSAVYSMFRHYDDRRRYPLGVVRIPCEQHSTPHIRSSVPVSGEVVKFGEQIIFW